ncbi:MAG: tRNA pseudouridine(55) synthase TruB [Candidatus Competibacteraceae bacterium]|nr:MAG: tRNA pseudouridine(55) synthase TruB [Candidatus Competibacteraceae bacterium]
MNIRNRRQVNGVLLLDKPVGWTSNAALQAVKRLYQAAKAGHTGSLDPLASGLLPICLGEATKLSGYLLDADKAYRFSCRLGVVTTTGDAEGEIVATQPVPALNRAEVEAALQRFTGIIQQIPPMYSALKRDGQPLYKLARRGIEVERQPRQVTIHELQLLRLDGAELECELRCSKGTYVRTLATDLGAVLGCGAHITALRRTAVEPYQTERMVSLETLRAQAEQGWAALDALLLPPDSAVAPWPAVRVQSDAAFYLRQGQPVLAPRAPTQGWVRLYLGEQQFLGLGEILDDGRVAPRRLLVGVGEAG